MPLYKTLEGWHQEVVEILIEARAEVNVPLLYGRTPLHFTAAMGQEHAALYLLRSGANTSIKDVFGVPPTMLCGTITFRH
jgi:ankyrin repeat protein